MQWFYKKYKMLHQKIRNSFGSVFKHNLIIQDL